MTITHITPRELELQAKVARLEEELAEWRFTNKVDELNRTVERLAAQLAALEAQEPVAQVHASNIVPIPDRTEWCREVLLYSPNNEGDCFQGVNTRVKLYLAAGAKP